MKSKCRGSPFSGNLPNAMFPNDYKWTNGFSYPHYRNMENTSIIEWEKLEDYSNCQTKFIAEENNFDKAAEQLETKKSGWV